MKFILGGRMGDLVHMLYVVKNTPGRHDLYITDRRGLHSDGFVYDLDKTIHELKAVLLYQDYINWVQPYNDEPDCINLNMWRSRAYSASWTNLLSGMFNVPVTGDAWIKSPIDHVYNKVIHCSLPGARRGNWDGVNVHGGVFMGSMQEYENFRRPELPHIIPHSLKQMFSIINSCKEFIGNQSLPLAIACSLDKPRTAVLNQVDAPAYIGEDKIFKNFSYVL